MTRPRTLTSLLALSAALFTDAAAATGPDSLMALIRDRNETIMAIVRSPTGGETEKERAQLREIVSGMFDFKAFAEASLGRLWEERTDAERMEFSSLCRQLIEKNYGDPKLYKKAEEITYVSAETPALDQGAVKTVVRYKTEKSTIEYRLRRDKEAWRIYDMVIDDLSVAESNRSQFRKEIRKTSYQGLVQKLKEKLAEG